jgi:hypothetical protein
MDTIPEGTPRVVVIANQDSKIMESGATARALRFCDVWEERTANHGGSIWDSGIDVGGES